jgi:hypothetical protein
MQKKKYLDIYPYLYTSITPISKQELVVNSLSDNLLCLTADDFTHLGESAATQWVNQTCTLLTLQVSMCPDAPFFIILLCLMPDDCTRQEESAATQWVNL